MTTPKLTPEVERRMTKDEEREIQNQLYAIICPLLAKYESRGFNSHARTQAIMVEVVERCNEWIAKQN